jgi:hypothetical protein
MLKKLNLGVKIVLMGNYTTWRGFK